MALRRGVLIGLPALLAGARGARGAAFLRESIRLAGPSMWLSSGAPGSVLAVVRANETVITGYGTAAGESRGKPGPQSLFRLASITKVFTAEVLARMVVRGELRLTDPLQRYAGTVEVPRFPDAPPITLLNLATHTAGLPRDMGSDLPPGPPFTWWDEADRWRWLAHERLHWAPGSVAAYSNIGFDLLADALSRAAARPYPELLRRYVSDPLRMHETTFDPTASQCERLMDGAELGNTKSCADTAATEGSGGLYSTGADVAAWLRGQLATTDPAMLISHAIYWPRQALRAAVGFSGAEAVAGLALGWVMVAPRGRVPLLLTKSGIGGGFMSYVALAPGTGVGAFVVANRVDLGRFARLARGVAALITSLVVS